MYGNLNSTIIGGYWSGGVSGSGHGPHVRFAGSGGANNIASFADKILAVIVQEERRFPERVEYITSVAGQRGPREKGESRWDYGLGRGGELVVITDLCIMRSNPETGLLALDTVFPGISVDDVVNNTGWSLDTSKASQMDPPTEDELKALRMLVDQHCDAAMESTLSKTLCEQGERTVAVKHFESDEHFELSQLRRGDLIDLYEPVLSVPLVGDFSSDVIPDGTPVGAERTHDSQGS